MNKLPIITGFILPDETFIESSGIGHNKVAFRYIVDNKLIKEFDASNLAEDDFMIEKLGAAKVAVYRGKKYIYLPKNHNWYLSQIKKMYVNAGYEVHYVHKSFCIATVKFEEKNKKINPYNKTVVQKRMSNNSAILCYNPIRIGD